MLLAKKQVVQNIEYDFLRQNYGDDMADGVLELITETICSSKSEIMIACELVLHSIVKERFLKFRITYTERQKGNTYFLRRKGVDK